MTVRELRSRAKICILCLLSLLEYIINRSGHQECTLRKIITFAVKNHLKPTDRFFQRHIRSRNAGELFCNREALRQEVLNLTGTVNRLLVFIRKLIIPMIAMIS